MQSGYGNIFTERVEGCYNWYVFGTYLHGPLLPKNPEIADFMIWKALKKRYPSLKQTDLTPLDDTLENKAKNALLRRMNINGASF